MPGPRSRSTSRPDARRLLLVRQGAGAGGLPVGSSGRVACLLSGGIDSPVAAWRMMRRGCRVLFVHFHSYPILSRASQEKARELAPPADALPAALAAVPRSLWRNPAARRSRPCRRRCAVVVYRRLMMRIAETHRAAASRPGADHRRGRRPGRLADAREHDASSGSGARCPVLRPLVGMDKDEITAEAQRLGTTQSRSFPTRTAARCSRPATRPPRPGGRRRARRGRAGELDEIVDDAVAATVLERLTLSAFRDHRMTRVKMTPGKLAGHEGGPECARRDCRGGDGPARLAAARRSPRSAAATSGRASSRNSRPRHRSADPARQCHPARSRVGTSRQPAARQATPAC